MRTSVRPYTPGLAAASAAILTLGLVTAPPDTGVVASRADAHVVRLAAVAIADISTAVGRTPLTFTAAVESASLPTYATMNTPTTSVSQPAAATQEAATSTVIPDEDDNPYLDQFLRPLLTIFVIVALPILVPISVGIYAWNSVVYIPNRLLDAFGLPGLPCAGSCDYNLFQTLSIIFGAQAATTSAAATAAVDSAGDSGSARARGSANATSSPAHSARNLVDKVGRPTRASSPAPNSGTATAVEAEKVTQDSTPAEQGQRGTKNSAKNAAADAKSAGSKSPSTGSSARGSGAKKSVHKVGANAKSGGSKRPSAGNSARGNSKKDQRH